MELLSIYKQKNATLIGSRFFCLWSIADSNRLPQHCQCCALPDELIPLISFANLRNENEIPTLIWRFFCVFHEFC